MALSICSADACHDMCGVHVKGCWSAGGMFLGTATIQINKDNNTRRGGCLSSDPAPMERAESWLPAAAASDLNPLTFGGRAGKVLTVVSQGSGCGQLNSRTTSDRVRRCHCHRKLELCRHQHPHSSRLYWCKAFTSR